MSLLPVLLLGGMTVQQINSLRATEVQQQLASTALNVQRYLEYEIQSWVAELKELAISQNVSSLDARGAKDVLLYKKSITPVQENLLLVGAGGSVLATTEGDADISMAAQEEVARALKGETVLKTTGEGEETSLMIAVPVNPGGIEVKGVLLGSFALEGLAEGLFNAATATTSIYLLDGQGGLLLSGSKEEGAASGSKEAVTFATLAAGEISAGRSGTGKYTNHTGQEVFGAYLPLKEINWGVVVERSSAEAMAASRRVIIFLILATGVIALLALALATILARGLTHPLNNLAAVAGQVARGDLNAEIKNQGQDEIGRLGAAFNRTIQGLRTIVKKITASAGSVASVAGNLVSSMALVKEASSVVRLAMDRVAAGAGKQAAGVQQVTATLSQIAAGMEHIAGRAEAIAGASSRTGDIAAQGARGMEQVLVQMASIKEQQGNLEEFITRLAGQVEAISGLVDAIDTIAEQTNLLALNAAIEAARAGEQGRGFAVVATEVKQLAAASGQAARDITAKVQSIQEEAAGTMAAMAAARRQVEIGGQVAQEAGRGFNNISAALAGVLQQVGEISAAVEEIAAGGQELQGAVQEIAIVSQETAGLSGEVLVALEHQEEAVRQLDSGTGTLQAVSRDLQQAVASFKI